MPVPMQVCELQIVHETMLSARAGLPGHAIYNRVRNASEIVEYKMGGTFASEALRLAALRIALGDHSKDKEVFPPRPDHMAFDDAKLKVTFDGEGHVTEIKLIEKQIPSAALNVLLSAVRDSVWGRLETLPLICHDLSTEDSLRMADVFGQAGRADAFGAGRSNKFVDLSHRSLVDADAILIAASLVFNTTLTHCRCCPELPPLCQSYQQPWPLCHPRD